MLRGRKPIDSLYEPKDLSNRVEMRIDMVAKGSRIDSADL